MLQVRFNSCSSPVLAYFYNRHTTAMTLKLLALSAVATQVGSTPLAAAPSALSRFPRQPHSLTPASTGPGHRPHQRPRRNPQLWQQPGEVRHPAPSGPAGRRLSGMRGHDWLRALHPVRQAGPRQPRHRARQGKAGARPPPRHRESARAPHAARLQQRLCHTAVPAALSVSNWDFVSPVCRSRMRSGPT